MRDSDIDLDGPIEAGRKSVVMSDLVGSLAYPHHSLVLVVFLPTELFPSDGDVDPKTALPADGAGTLDLEADLVMRIGAGR